MSEDPLWDRHDVAEFLGVELSTVKNWIKRRKVPVAGHSKPVQGRVSNLYRSSDIRRAKAEAPGKGNRTPRKPRQPEPEPAAEAPPAVPLRASAIAQMLRRWGILTRDDSRREGVRLRGGGPFVHLTVDIESNVDRANVMDAVTTALNVAGYVFTAVDRDGFGKVSITGRRDPKAPVPPDAPVVYVDVVGPGRALVLIKNRDASGRIGRDGSRFYVEDTDTEYLIPVRADSYRHAGDMFARLHGITGPVRVEVDHE